MSAPTFHPAPAPRRAFLARLAAAVAALAGGGAVVPAAAAAAVGGDDAWLTRLTGKHKAVFDAPEIADGIVVGNASVFYHSHTTARGLKDADLSAVVVIRHAAIPMALDDAMWEKYDAGKLLKLKDPSTGKWARRNQFWRAAPGDAANAPYTLDALRGRGAILLGCELALRRLSGRLAERTKQQPAAVRAELEAHLIPGLELAPSGIYAVTRAQEAGCSYVRST